MKRPAVVEIEWSDTYRVDHGWQAVKHYQHAGRKPIRLRTVGYLIAETPKQLTVVRTYDHRQRRASAGEVIVRGQIIRMRTLEG